MTYYFSDCCKKVPHSGIKFHDDFVMPRKQNIVIGPSAPITEDLSRMGVVLQWHFDLR